MASGPLVVYYSRTGNTDDLAESIASYLGDPTIEEIEPTRSRRYPNWLARSFVPGSTVPIEPPVANPAEFDAVFLGSPKWTFSCPPVTEYVRRVDFGRTPTGLFLTFGGFDEERYVRALSRRLERAGAAVAARLLVKRDRLGADDLDEGVAAFCEAVLDAVG